MNLRHAKLAVFFSADVIYIGCWWCSKQFHSYQSVRWSETVVEGKWQRPGYFCATASTGHHANVHRRHRHWPSSAWAYARGHPQQGSSTYWGMRAMRACALTRVPPSCA
jgi:hypothetical protein